MQFNLNETQTHTFQDFVVTLAREQYKVGSRSGAGWAFKKVREEKPPAQPAGQIV